MNKKDVLKVIPIRSYDYNNECYVCEDGKIKDIIKIQTKDIVSMSESDIEYDMSILTLFFRVYKDDFKIIGINVPTNCQSQIRYLHKMIDNCTDEFKRMILMEKLAEEEWIEKNRTEKEFEIMYFAKNIEEYLKIKELILNRLVEKKFAFILSKAEKDRILYKINNKNEK